MNVNRLALAVALTSLLTTAACGSSDEEQAASGGSGAGAAGGAAGAAGTGGAGGAAGTAGTGGTETFDENPDPLVFLDIPAEQDTIHVVVTGDGWSGYDASCTGVSFDGSHHDNILDDVDDSPGENLTVQPNPDCVHGESAVFHLSRLARLQPGVYDITPGGDPRAGAALAPEGYPADGGELLGQLWIRTVAVGRTTLLEASYYGSASWLSSTDAPHRAEVLVQVAFKVDVRNDNLK